MKTSCLSLYTLNFLFSRKGRVAELSNKSLHLLDNISPAVRVNILKVTTLVSSLLFCFASGGAQGNHLSLLFFFYAVNQISAHYLKISGQSFVPSNKWREIQTPFASTV